jgi:hypothetical protein
VDTNLIPKNQIHRSIREREESLSSDQRSGLSWLAADREAHLLG